MLVGLIGSRFSGKKTLCNYLCTLGFKKIDEPNEIKEAWKANYVMIITSHEQAEAMKKWPYFLLLSVEAPISLRWSWCRAQMHSDPPQSLEDFLEMDEATLYGRPTNLNDRMLCEAMHMADLRIINNGSLEDMYDNLLHLDVPNPERLRPSWDTYFMCLAYLASLRSNCMKRRVGAIIVKDNRVIATGYNGTPRGAKNCNDGGCARCNAFTPQGQALEECLCLHAEENAIVEAGRARAEGGALFCSLCPCLGCTKKIIQAGIKKVVYAADYAMDAKSAALFEETQVELHKYAFPPAYEPQIPALTSTIIKPTMAPSPCRRRVSQSPPCTPSLGHHTALETK
eukprot:TRINITY_DN4648_c0_g1::TRINITY_DN4648_c0_g1_i1::g.19504::m.19504 TRINITY_DN4648_c0_g1::TRINITY_DN4648_c0_g1_i1::g.19504  ORF type:complete len:341 (-),score=37.99,sp/O43012/DCTD_SCHPO/41.93/3e-70,dCMP_cyt_deam_1/PF00383.17/2.8e-25,AAA_17/PF13207.1/0.36 TRINITY_DN4648_c0_g1_i1:2-1024(-)